MTSRTLLRWTAAAIVLLATHPGRAAYGADVIFQVSTTSGSPGTTAFIETLNVNNFNTPLYSYQITGLNSPGQINAASFDLGTNRLYYVYDHGGQADLQYAQIGLNGNVVGQTTVGTLPGITNSFGADFYDNRVWISQDGTNQLYGFNPNNLAGAPTVLTLPTPAGFPSTNFDVGDLTFNASNNTLFITGLLRGSLTDFFYEYQLNGSGTPTLINSINFPVTSAAQGYNGLIYDSINGVLYGYQATMNSSMFAVNTTTLMPGPPLGSNYYLGFEGDLAGSMSAIPEPSSIVSLGVGMGVVIAGLLLRLRPVAFTPRPVEAETWTERKSICTPRRRFVLPVSLLLAAAWLWFPGSARAGSLMWLFNCDFVCPVDGANDFHVKFETNGGSANVTKIFVGPSQHSGTTNQAFFTPTTGASGGTIPVPIPTADQPYVQLMNSSPDPNVGELTLQGTTFNKNNWTHVGALGAANPATILDSWWTKNGTTVGNIDGHMPGVKFAPFDPNSQWMIIRVSLYDPQNNLIGNEWAEMQAGSFTLTGSSVPLDVSTATMLSPVMIPLDQLNENLTGFGPQSPITLLGASPEPPSMILASLGFVGLSAYSWTRRRCRYPAS